MNYELNLFYAKERYGAVPDPPSSERALRYLKALLTIVGSDGTITEHEWNSFLTLSWLMGLPPDSLDELRDFDFRHTRLEDHLEGLTDGAASRRMLYDAIKIAHTDGYSPREQEAALRAGKLLGIDPSVVIALEGMVSIEDTLARARRQLLTQSG